MSELEQSRLAADYPRQLLPRPVSVESKRRSGYPAYVSPRPGRVQLPHGARHAAKYMNYLGMLWRIQQPTVEHSFKSHVQETIDADWWGRVEGRRQS
jgi:hypothetical protein